MTQGGQSAARSERAGASASRTAERALHVWTDSGARRFLTRAARLSGKEQAVLAALARGQTTEEIGERLLVSPHTVRTHIKNAMRKLEARTRAHAVAIAMADGAIEYDPAD
jgi:DNA-binding CsgD family transcriptional regulator